MSRLQLIALPGIPRVEPGDDLVSLLLESIERLDVELGAGDVLVVAQKIVSKAEGRYVSLATVEPSERARRLAEEVDKDPRLVELILSESDRVVRQRPGVLIVAHRLGLVLANAGIDRSNLRDGEAEEVLLLPEDPDASAAALRAGLAMRTGIDVGVVINDSLGRPWRLGTTGVAIGVAGVASLVDLRGDRDLRGRELLVSQQAVADEVAAAASLLQGQADEGIPAVLVRGLEIRSTGVEPSRTAAGLVRPLEDDLFV